MYLSQVGVREHGCKNCGADVEKYQRFGGGKRGDAWCAWFVSWCLRQAGYLTPLFGRARSWFDAAHVVWRFGQQVAGRAPPEQGDLVGYTWGLPNICHVGFLDLWGTGPACQTVEGNTSGGKQSREGEGVYVNWRLKRMVAMVARVSDNPRYAKTRE